MNLNVDYNNKSKINYQICKLISDSNSDIKFTINNKSNNLGKCFLNNEKLLIKFGNIFELNEQYEYGSLLYELKNIYPYFTNIHSYFICQKSDLGTIGKLFEDKYDNIDVLVIQKKDKTIYEWVNDHVYKFIKKNIPNYEDIILELDNIYIKVFENNNIYVVKKYYYRFIHIYNNKEVIITDDFLYSDNEKVMSLLPKIKKEYEELIYPIVKELFIVSLKFNNEFVPLLKKNLKLIYYQHFIINMISLLYLNTIITDTNADNFMIHTEQWNENKSNFIKIKIKTQEFDIINVADWGDEKEIIYLYPIDFPNILDNDNKLKPKPDLNKVYSKNFLYKGSLYTKQKEEINTIKDNLYDIIKSLLYYNFYSDEYNKKITKNTIKNNCINNNNIFLSYNNTFINKYNLFKFDITSSLNIYSKLYHDKLILLDTKIVDLYDLFIYLLLLINKEYPPDFIQNNLTNLNKNDPLLIINLTI